jgi:cell wall-associated NlpC family hydrolase
MDLGGGTGDSDFNPWAHYVTGHSGWHSHDANNFWDYGLAMHVSLEARKPGDLISYPGHIAIYIGDDQIIHAYTPDTGVIYDDMWNPGTPRGCIRLFQ